MNHSGFRPRHSFEQVLFFSFCTINVHPIYNSLIFLVHPFMAHLSPQETLHTEESGRVKVCSVPDWTGYLCLTRLKCSISFQRWAVAELTEQLLIAPWFLFCFNHVAFCYVAASVVWAMLHMSEVMGGGYCWGSWLSGKVCELMKRDRYPLWTVVRRQNQKHPRSRRIT